MSRGRWMTRVARALSVSVLLMALGGILWTPGALAASGSSGSGSHASQGKGGAQLWAENCARCHEMRSSSQYSNREWDLIVHQMRIRANLTAKEYEAIRKYLTSGS